jgi:thioredoxin-dependent peroxiredoxin
MLIDKETEKLSMLKIMTISALGIAMTLAAAEAAELKPGDEAPAFSLPGSDGKTYSLADYKGKQVVVLAWFPKAFTSGWTAECKSFRENGNAISEFNVAYFTASVDTPEENKKFAESLGADYPILSDPGKKVAEAYGVVHEGRPVAERWTFYIGKDGKILYVDRQVRAQTAAQDVVNKLKELNIR